MRVYELERLVDHLYRTLNIERPEPSMTASAEVRRLAASGNTIMAIKRFREETGADLVTAKKVVDGLPSI
jgi:ribosomal protein L7/L12